MFELTLSIPIEKQKYLLNFQKKLTDDINGNVALCISHNHDGRNYLALAVDGKNKEFLKSQVLDCVLDVIINEYKYNFFKDSLSSLSADVMMNPFLKAISIFDADCDLEVIRQEIDLSGEVVIDSFFYFKLSALKQRWQKTADVIIKNGIIQSDSAMIQVIKYLVDSAENFSLVASVKIGKKQLKIKNYKGSMKFKANQEGVSKFLTEIIGLNPIKINLIKNFDEEKHCKTYEILKEIFGEKIYLQN